MTKPFLRVVGGSEVAIFCTLALATACTGTIGPAQGTPGQAGSNPAGVGGTGTPGSGGSTGAGGSSSGTAGTGATGGGTGATGGAAMVDVGTIYPNPPAFAPAPGLLRRLTRNQFRNAVRDVFAYDVSINDLDADSFTANFASIGAATVVTSDRGVEQYSTAIENAVNAVFADATKRGQFIGCTPTGQSNDTCVRGFIQKLGLRAWRRPLDSAELDRFVALAASASTTLGSATEGARWATVALFTSPSFLYRPELGASSGGALRLSGYEMASRLSFLVWNSLPDQMLMDQATGGMLATADGIRTAATRMLNTAAGRESVGGFAEEYMRLDRIATQAKDPALFPEYGTNLQTAMVRDIRDTWASLAFDDQASFYDLFTTTKVVVNADLARLYGIDATGLTATTFQTKSLPAGGTRSGVLTKAGLLSEFANQQSGSPTLRGKFIREALMCLEIPPPPPGVNTAVVDQPTNVPMTRRQKLEVHIINDGCAACHKYMDPLGFPLENFDAVGKYRTTDNGLPVDASGSFDSVPVADANDLGVAASQSVTVAQCLVRKYYAYAVGHAERDVDGSALNTLATAFKASGFKMRDLILAVVTNDAFSLVAPQP